MIIEDSADLSDSHSGSVSKCLPAHAVHQPEQYRKTVQPSLGGGFSWETIYGAVAAIGTALDHLKPISSRSNMIIVHLLGMQHINVLDRFGVPCVEVGHMVWDRQECHSW